jgi:hypothetical protein
VTNALQCYAPAPRPAAAGRAPFGNGPLIGADAAGLVGGALLNEALRPRDGSDPACEQKAGPGRRYVAWRLGLPTASQATLRARSPCHSMNAWRVGHIDLAQALRAQSVRALLRALLCNTPDEKMAPTLRECGDRTYMKSNMPPWLSVFDPNSRVSDPLERHHGATGRTVRFGSVVPAAVGQWPCSPARTKAAAMVRRYLSAPARVCLRHQR